MYPRFLLVLFLWVLTLPAGCRSDHQSVTMPAPSNNSTVAGADDDLTPDGDQGQSGAKSPSSCKPKSCKKIPIKLVMKSASGSGRLTSYEGTSNTKNSVIFAADLAEDRQVGVIVTDPPYGASVEDEEGQATLHWTPDRETSGSFDVRVRDIDRCKALEKDDDCTDMEASGFEKYEESETFAYSIKIDAAARAEKERREAEEQAKDDKCKAAMMQAGLGALGGLIGTTTTTTTKPTTGKPTTTSTTTSTINGGQVMTQVGGAVVSCM
jgi:hypothetical protein